jgi:membrane-bound acyltransferase YfiQ involved in biofilm formation
MIEAVLTGRTTDAFYYIPVLIQLFLLAPFLIPLARTRWKLLLVSTALIQVFIHIIRYDQILGLKSPVINPITFLARNWLFPGYIFWFTLGIAVGFHLPQLKIMLGRIKWVLLGSLIVTFFLGFVEWEVLLALSGESWISPRETLIDNLYALSLILCFLAFEKVVYPFPQSLPNLGIKSYGVYLVHSLVLIFTAKVLYHLLPKILAYPILFVLVLIVMGLGVPLLLMKLVNKSPVRRYYETLFG